LSRPAGLSSPAGRLFSKPPDNESRVPEYATRCVSASLIANTRSARLILSDRSKTNQAAPYLSFMDHKMYAPCFRYTLASVKSRGAMFLLPTTRGFDC
jgi:hypothetical protein